MILGLYLVFSGLERLLVEFIRRNKEILAGLTGPQLESVVLMAIGIVLLGLMARGAGFAQPGGSGGADVSASGNGVRARASTA